MVQFNIWGDDRGVDDGQKIFQRNHLLQLLLTDAMHLRSTSQLRYKRGLITSSLHKNLASFWPRTSSIRVNKSSNLRQRSVSVAFRHSISVDLKCGNLLREPKLCTQRRPSHVTDLRGKKKNEKHKAVWQLLHVLRTSQRIHRPQWGNPWR